MSDWPEPLLSRIKRRDKYEAAWWLISLIIAIVVTALLFTPDGG